ncbi:MAG: FAD-dependent thymidylate synthase [Candidatus Berkelbacteria bacterium]|nr:MAG: FAD-dependent thymidylate synthase [Candidatus Berkelbacteria bacterium]QQG51836.1 MAG: FAD-dependent thymidylate synthase [Candidatus Berkelbacteria bacterium]
MAKSSETENPFVKFVPVISDEGYAYLDAIVTNTRDQVYSFTDKLSPAIIGAAMARLSRRAGDLRMTLIEEFSQTGEEDAEALFDRVITAYGDDSVQQLAGAYFVVEGASNLLTKALEWGRFTSPLEQSTRYIFFDSRDINGRYLYFTPTNLPSEIAQDYNQTMDEIFNLYSSMVRGLAAHLRVKNPEPADRKERTAWLNSTRATACDAIRTVLPAATKSTVGIFASAQAIEYLVMRLLSEDLEEFRTVGTKTLAECRKVIRPFLKRADVPERGGAITAFLSNTRTNLRQFAERNLTSNDKLRTSDGDVMLLDHWPKNEEELLAEMLFAYSDLPQKEIRRQVQKWPQKKVDQLFKLYCGERLNRRHKPGRAFEKAHFEWEILNDYGTFRDLQRHRVVDGEEWQRLTPDYGYHIPALVKEGGYEEEFTKCFELSYELYQRLRSSGFEAEAQYATLLGHKMRYRYIFNARALFHFLELRTGPDGHPGYRRICLKMYEQFAKVYPRIAKAMKFINSREDPELTRLAAERAAQYKLEKLGQQALSSE